MSVTKQDLNVGGLPVNIYSKVDSAAGTQPVVGFFLLHGRHGSAEKIDPIARTVVEQALSTTSIQKRDLVVVTFDQRNHGHRLTDPKANDGWGHTDTDERNNRHALDMYAIQTGTARDVSFLIDFLPSFLYPNDERTIIEWGVAGISLGGHSTWIGLCTGKSRPATIYKVYGNSRDRPAHQNRDPYNRMSRLPSAHETAGAKGKCAVQCAFLPGELQGAC